MTKEEYQAWLGMDLTKKALALWDNFLDMQNKELVNGRLIREGDKLATDVNYYSVVGYNRAHDDLREFSYEQVAGLNEIELAEKEEEDEQK